MIFALLAAAFVTTASASQPGPWRRTWGWGSDPLHEKYEELLEGEFPARRYDPFNRLRPFEDVRAFARGVERREEGVTTRVAREEQAVVMEVRWPGSAQTALDVTVSGRLVLLRPPAEAAASPYRFRAERAREIVVAVPDGADPGAVRMERRGDVVRLTFAKGGT